MEYLLFMMHPAPQTSPNQSLSLHNSWNPSFLIKVLVTMRDQKNDQDKDQHSSGLYRSLFPR
jgi:hypothetical protein